MNEWILILGLILGFLVVIGIILTRLALRSKKEINKKEPNYQVFFIIGFIWIPVGIVFMITINPVLGVAFMGLGVSYIAIGLRNRDKWDKKKF